MDVESLERGNDQGLDTLADRVGLLKMVRAACKAAGALLQVRLVPATLLPPSHAWAHA